MTHAISFNLVATASTRPIRSWRTGLLAFTLATISGPAFADPTAPPASRAAPRATVAMAIADPAPDPAPYPAGSSAYPAGAGSPGSAASAGSTGSADGAKAPSSSSPADRWAIFGQSTFTAMTSLGFRSPYVGANSLPPHDLRETFDATLYLGARPWAGGELWVNPEIDQGFGIGNTLGLAGFPSGEAYKVGRANPYDRIQRLFFRQTVNLTGAASAINAAPNQMAGTQSPYRLVITLGKFSVADVFDTNRYAHDPRGDFLNWAVLDSGAFDYAADAYGYSYGAAAELDAGAWIARLGAFNPSKDPNGTELETGFRQNQLIAEIEHDFQLASQPGAIRLALWHSHGRLARFSDAIAWGIANQQAPDYMQVRRVQGRWGGYLNAEQALTGTLGVFVRASRADGRVASYDFTDIDGSVSAGLSLAGKGWHRSADTLGVALIANQASKDMQRYLAAGGLGLLVGDGRLPHPGTEALIESYYAWRPIAPVTVTLDYQLAVNPGYNRDRGPVNIVGLRLHTGF